MAQPIKADNFRFNAFQGIIFTPATQISTSKILSRILEKFADRFDGPPTVLPIPPEAPAEIPRVVLQSADPQWFLEVALTRVNFRWVQMKDEHQLQPIEFNRQFIEFVDSFLQVQSLQIGRLALAVNRYVLNENPAALIAESFCKDSLIQKAPGGLEAVELHLHQKKKLAGDFDVNEWIRFKSGLLTIPDTPVRKIALVEQDINTPGENTAEIAFTIDQVRKFFEAATVASTASFRSFWEN